MRRRFSAETPLPLTLALQGVALTIAAFFSLSLDPEPAQRAGTGDLPTPDAPAMSDLLIPRDLARERLPVPKFPKLDEPDPVDRAPEPNPESPKAPIAAGDMLSALRVTSVALAGLVRMDSPTPIPDAPDTIGSNDLGGNSGRSWLGGDQRTSRGAGGFAGPSDSGDDGSGWGGTGVGGSGHGSGGNCPAGGGGGGRIGRPAGGSGGTVGRPAPPSRPTPTAGGPTRSGSGGSGPRGGGPRGGGERPGKGRSGR
jgi:hypothetical protein